MKTVSYELAKEMLGALKPFISATLTDNGSVVGLMLEDFERARDAAAKAEAAMACPQPDSDGWIKWEGGKRPVDADTLVDCKLRDGYVEGCQKASFFDWSDIDSDSDIIAYRIVEGD